MYLSDKTHSNRIRHSLGTGVCPIFQQLDIWDEFTRISKYYLQMGIFDENLKHAYDMDIDWLKRM